MRTEDSRNPDPKAHSSALRPASGWSGSPFGQEGDAAEPSSLEEAEQTFLRYRPSGSIDSPAALLYLTDPMQVEALAALQKIEPRVVRERPIVEWLSGHPGKQSLGRTVANDARDGAATEHSGQTLRAMRELDQTERKQRSHAQRDAALARVSAANNRLAAIDAQRRSDLAREEHMLLWQQSELEQRAIADEKSFIRTMFHLGGKLAKALIDPEEVIEPAIQIIGEVATDTANKGTFAHAIVRQMRSELLLATQNQKGNSAYQSERIAAMDEISAGLNDVDAALDAESARRAEIRQRYREASLLIGQSTPKRSSTEAASILEAAPKLDRFGEEFRQKDIAPLLPVASAAPLPKTQERTEATAPDTRVRLRQGRVLAGAISRLIVDYRARRDVASELVQTILGEREVSQIGQ